MKLQNYYQKRGSSCDIYQDAELRKDITDLLDIAALIESPAITTEKQKSQMLQEEQMRIAGFAYYLLDYQGFYDDFFKKRLRSLSIFAGMIFLRKVNFFGAEHRLLEITKKYDLAICCPQKENVAKFILCNLDKYSKKELQIIRYRLEHASISVLYERPNVCLLYKICCYKTSWWRLIF